MRILEVKELAIPEVKVIRFGRFTDDRGYFSEVLRQSDFDSLPALHFLKNLKFPQINESFSHKNVIRGLHFQWNPYMGKLVRVVNGNIIDVALDIRKKSPTEGKIVGYEMRTKPDQNYQEWIWLPPGFAHGVYFLDDTQLVYYCTGEYNPDFERTITPFAEDIDWSLFEKPLLNKIEAVKKEDRVISDKDNAGMTFAQWKNSNDAENFIYPS